MTEETKELTTEDQAMLEQAVQQALATPVPEEAEKAKPYLHQQVSRELLGVHKKFRTGSKNKTKWAAKLDADGKELVHANGGAIYIKASE